MKKLALLLTFIFSLTNIYSQNLAFDNLNANYATSKSITWFSSNYGSGFGHRIINSDPGGKTLLNFQGRHNTGTWSNILTLTSNGNVGVGINSPVAKLHVFDNNLLNSSAGDFQILSRLQGRSSNHFMENKWLLRDSNGTDWLRTRLHNAISIDASFLTPGVDTRTWWERDPWDNIQSWGNSSETYMSLVKGKLGIGTTTPDSKLSVNGDIHSKKVKVDMVGWSDFVFKKAYNLPTLEEVEKHIQEKGHLQDIPSTQEVKENGIDLGEMDAKLLQKIEELTLYTIEQEKKLEKVKDLENKLAKLEKLVEQLINDKK